MLSLVFVAFWMLAPPSDAHAANAAESFVQSNIDRGYVILNDGASNAAQRQLQFRDLLLSMVDVKRVALFTLGPYARDAGEADIEKFTAAFTDYLTAVYRRGLDTYKGEALEVIGSNERAQDDVIVNVIARDRSATSSPARIGFRVRRAKSGGTIITDLEIEGAWLAITQRAEFIAYLERHGGDVAELAMELEERAARIRATDGELR
jgi:ABC-type transporter MlaC component